MKEIIGFTTFECVACGRRDFSEPEFWKHIIECQLKTENKMSREKEFARELKGLCKTYRVGVFDANFNLLIEDHSKTHVRKFIYKDRVENEGIEHCELYTSEVKQV